MQIFLFGALAISLAAVLFALQNNIPVTVSFFGWTFSGSLAVILFLAVAAGIGVEEHGVDDGSLCCNDAGWKSQHKKHSYHKKVNNT